MLWCIKNEPLTEIRGSVCNQHDVVPVTVRQTGSGLLASYQPPKWSVLRKFLCQHCLNDNKIIPSNVKCCVSNPSHLISKTVFFREVIMSNWFKIRLINKFGSDSEDLLHNNFHNENFKFWDRSCWNFRGIVPILFRENFRNLIAKIWNLQ